MAKIRLLFAAGVAGWFALKLYGLGTWTWEQSNQAEPCTRAISMGEDVRAGRWWWENPEHKECGLHKK